jgi:hypothetical protein
MATTSRLIASLCCALAFSGAAFAQGSNGDNPQPSGAASVDCDKDSYASTSGTGSNQPVRSHRARSSSRQSAAMHGNMPAAYEQCLNGNDRSARAECVRRTYESRVGTSGTGSLSASSGMRRPC